MKARRTGRLTMSLRFSLFVCCIFLITAGIVALLGVVMIHSGMFHAFGGVTPLALILVVLCASILVGTAVSAVIGRFPLRPVHRVIEQMKELAGGNFHAHLNADGPLEYRKLAESFNSMARELGSIEMLRSDFVNNFSHEFKTPIVSIKGFAELLKYGDLTEEERGDYLDIVIDESARLAELTANVLYLSKIENQEILSEREPFALGEQIRHMILLLQPKWEGKRIDMNVDLLDMCLDGNEEMLGQVWLNLIDNAIKFTPEGGSISICLTKKEANARIVIRDNGCGIRAEALPRVFDRFYQGDTSHALQGNGLGLTLATEIIGLHKGTIRCESEEGHGTVFTVELPVQCKL